ncbi:hypothetical protein ABNQ38_06625 (plasmid) [Azospirillum sp. A29]|uniref:hypothetical protein n=1 Tax=Azospirillum sp. A29 TaxID=3160606 RepID=UPI003672CEBD
MRLAILTTDTLHHRYFVWSPPLLSLCPGAFLNLHGGDPEDCRGFDTHLWAIYHGDFAALATTLHHVSPDLDAGDIVATLPLPLHRGMGLHQLRRSNTEICVRLVQEALAGHGSTGSSRPWSCG